jgi:hypothetical protein
MRSTRRRVCVHAAHSGRTQGLLTWWLMTGSGEAESLLERYMSCFVIDEGICISPDGMSVRAGGGVCLAGARSQRRSMFFWHFGAGHALIDYYEPDGARGPARGASYASPTSPWRRGQPGYSVKAVAFARAHADDPAPIASISASTCGVPSIYSCRWCRTTPRSTAVREGCCAVGGRVALLAQRAALRDGALDGDPELSEEHGSRWSSVDAEGGSPYTPPLLSWQSEYDRPDLEEYLRIKHPQP